ncbi:uncharacterized protein [Rhodnius prolixus]|uniref:uncharacterized protein n=1 Tax=Rhodnius prolixus TaxID=13249 RepID=UPI003D18D3D5
MLFICLAVLALVSLVGNVYGEGNLSCYQCTKKTSEPCPEENLLPCPSNRDRCVTHISKDANNGFVLKRECGLGPCGFEDDMVNRGLGLDHCDTSKDEYFCVFCCKESGCNKDSLSSSPHPLIIFIFFSIALLFRR